MRKIIKLLAALALTLAQFNTFAAGELPDLNLPIHWEGEQSDVYLLAIERIDESWLKEKSLEHCSDGLRFIFVAAAKAPDAIDFSISPNAWIEINETNYRGISEHRLKEEIPPQIFVANIAPDFENYAAAVSLEGKKTKILDIYFPGIEIPSIEKLKVRIYIGWFRTGESLELQIIPGI